MMKIFLVSTLLSLSSVVFSQEFTVFDRRNDSGVTYKKVQLQDLISTDSFDGKYFKIVLGKNAEAIKFNGSKDLVFKAANAYHHLTQARLFWRDVIKADPRSLDDKLVVRLEITNLYDDLGHFANDNRDPQYNNALSIPRGESPEFVEPALRESWGNEIWFRPKKIVNVQSMAKTLGDNPLTQSLKVIKNPLIDYFEYRFIFRLTEALIAPTGNYSELSDEFVKFLGTIALSMVVINSSQKLDPLFVEKYFYIDSAAVPEIIYHEYAHVILSDSLQMSHSTPVIEGMADYFATALAQNTKMYDHIKGFNLSEPKNVAQKKFYTHWDESNDAANGDFVISLLWQIRGVIGPEVTNKLIYESRKSLSTNSSSISDGLIRSLLENCSKVCRDPMADRLKLLSFFQSRGF